MTETRMVNSTMTMIYPTDAVDRSDEPEKYLLLDNTINSVNEMYDWISTKVVDFHYITKKKHGECDFKNRITSISIPLSITKLNDHLQTLWYIFHECAHAISIKLKHFSDHGKFFHHILIEMMEIFIDKGDHSDFILCEAAYKKRIIGRWNNWIKWRMKDENYREVFPATLPVFGKSQGGAIRSN